MQQLDNFAIDLSLRSSPEFTVDLCSLPYLADHGFLDMLVLPGSFYIDMAMSLERQFNKRVPALIRNIAFHHPVVLSTQHTIIKVELKDCGDNRIEYRFYETNPADGNNLNSVGKHAASLEIDRNIRLQTEAETEHFWIQTAQSQSTVIDPQEFYKRLRENGNQYGPSFQNVSSIWSAGNQCLGELSIKRVKNNGAHVVHPTILDSFTQLLAPFVMEKGKPFVLRTIEKIEIWDVSFPDTLWAHATGLRQSDADEKSFVGNVSALDESGKKYLECSGIAVTLLDKVDRGANAARTFAIASNFTAEPLQESMEFWSNYFDWPVHFEFAPYNQLFQQLLDSGSVLRKNRDGINIILLNMEEWVAGHDHGVMAPSRARADQLFSNYETYVLANGLEIAHLNRYETEYLYKEIFEDECYLRHGITLNNGDTVVDIGANIGLFSLFVLSNCKDARIYAFEPAPAVYQLLKANCEVYGSNVRVVNAGVSDKSKTGVLTFYETSSVFSGFHADETEDSNAIRAIVRSMLENETSAEREDLDSYVDELIAGRLSRQTHKCQMVSVSDIIRENHLEKINLLKIDAEKSELEIINGIEECDWPKIDQMVIEIHDPTSDVVKQIEDLLIVKGFRCVVAQESLLKRSGLFNLYATRVEVKRDVRPISNLQRNVEDFCVALRSFMKESTAPLVLSICPRSPSTEANAQLRMALQNAERTLISEAGTIPNVHNIDSTLPLRLYPIADYYDLHSRTLGNIPFTAECYAAIGTTLFRKIFNLNRAPFKVIVLDCDETLWDGACAEVGPMGVEVGPASRVLQEFMLDQMNTGKLLCLCSKNNEGDVLAVFDQRTDLLLKREDLVSWRINWKSKSENIQSLANELDLGLDSFIFMDDNPVECADVRTNAPNVLTLQVPRSISSISSFLNHLWAFDNVRSTNEDRNRTRLYQENAKRSHFYEQTLSLKDFIKGLQLRIEISEVSDEQLGRVSQLTFRTNQFNFTGIRRSENEIRHLLKLEQVKCQVVHVVDRFGDYGLVGIVIYEIKANTFKVDSFLMSCRVLGRGVEHAILSHLGQLALRANKKFVEFTCVPTERNLPALNFIKNVADRFWNETHKSWICPAEYLMALEYHSEAQGSDGNEKSLGLNVVDFKHQLSPRLGVIDLSQRLQHIAEVLSDIDQLTKAIEEYRFRTQAVSTNEDSSGLTPMQSAVMNIWKEVLGRSQISMNDNFFEVGGTSLKAVQVIAMIKKELKQNLSIVSLFEYPTVSLLARKLNDKGTNRGNNQREAVLRGQKRLVNVMRRRAH